jgi:hypothetical protein
MKTGNSSKAQASSRTQEHGLYVPDPSANLVGSLQDDTACIDSQLILGSGEKCGEKGGALRHCVDEDVFVNGMGAVADGAEAVERGNAERGGEVAIGAAPSSGFTQ